MITSCFILLLHVLHQCESFSFHGQLIRPNCHYLHGHQRQKNYHGQQLPLSKISECKMVTNDNEMSEIPIRYLGKGERAIVRPGAVLVSPSHEYSHWL